MVKTFRPLLGVIILPDRKITDVRIMSSLLTSFMLYFHSEYSEETPAVIDLQKRARVLNLESELNQRMQQFDNVSRAC